jgi:hypothetical protein
MNDRLEGFLSRLPCCRTQALHQDRLVAGWSVIAARRRLEYFWPAFAVGVGLLGVLVWTLFLGWLLGQAVLAIF